MRSRRLRGRHLVGLVAAAVAVALLAPATAGASGHVTTTNVRILTVSDWHAQLDPLSVFGVGSFGGAAELKAYFDMERAGNPNTLVFTAGDAYGASPPLSSFFDEEPAVRAMRMIGFDADTFGNHNFDRGIAHLQSMIDIATAPPAAEPGKPFTYVSANLKRRDANLSRVKDYQIFDVAGVKIAVIGVTNPEAPTLVFPGSFGTIEVTDPVPAAMRAQKAARAEGAQIFIALAHMGVEGFLPGGQPFGPIVDFARGVRGFHLIVGDHTNVEYSGRINGQLVVENQSKGRTYARVDMTLRTAAGRTRLAGTNVTFVAPDSTAVTPDPGIVAFLDPLRTELTALLSGVIGESTVFVPRSDECGQSSGRTCESLVGNVVTDALRETYGTDFAITNSGGLRSPLTCPEVDDPVDFCPPNTPPNFQITDGQVLTLLPFGNSVVTLDVTGEQLLAHLENGVSSMPGASGRFAQVSGLCFTYDVHLAPGSRVTSVVYQNADGTCSADPVDLSAASTYSLAENDFMASGGDDYPALIGQAVTRNVMDQDVAAWVEANSPITPMIQGRITCTSSGATACPVPLP